ncbi:MAG: apolipoprotein N-acyltransferase [Bacteroidota bacterium]
MGRIAGWDALQCVRTLKNNSIEIIRKYRILSGSAATGIALLAVAMMIMRNRAELLWGYWTLVLFLGFTVGFTLLLSKKTVSDSNEQSHLLKSWLTGLLLGLAFPFSNLPTGFLALLAFIPLLRVIEKLRETNRPVKSAFYYSFQAFLLWNIVATYWVANSSLPAGLFAIIVNSLLMTLPVLGWYKVHRYIPRLQWVPLLAFWLCFEYMHFHWELNWPWLTLGNVWANAPALVQWYEFTGAMGGSLWIWIVNILVLAAWKHFRAGNNGQVRWLQLGIFLILPLVFSIIRYYTYTEQGPSQKVVAVQPNVEPFYGRDQITDQAFMDRLVDLSLSQVDATTSFLAFPETTLDFANQDALASARQIRELQLRVLNDYPNLQLLAGIEAFRILTPGESGGRYTRTRTTGTGTQRFEIYNAAINLGRGEEPIDFYKKSKLVPGAELFPYPGLLSFLKPLVESFGGTMAGRGAQKERSVFKTDAGKAVPAICYESVFGEHIAAHVRNGGETIFVLTNDAWWSKTAGHRQHFHYARLRAIENRRAVTRAANTGISTFINQKGKVLQATKYNETIAIKADIHFNDELTYYSKNPNLIGRLALFATVAFLLNGLVRNLLPGTEKK